MTNNTNKHKQTETMNDNYQILENILNNWNTTAKQQGDACFKLAKECIRNGQSEVLIESQVQYVVLKDQMIVLAGVTLHTVILF